MERAMGKIIKEVREIGIRIPRRRDPESQTVRVIYISPR
jgi:hypothetical protein